MLEPELGPATESPARVAERHREVYGAIAGRDLPRALAAVTAHFEGIRQRLARPT